MYLDVSEPNNIWQKNPQLRLNTYCRKYYEKEGEDWFNKCYYAIYLVYEPLSPLRKTETNEKVLRANVKSSYFTEEEQKRLNWNNLKTLTKEYKEVSITKESKIFSKWAKSLEQSSKVLEKFVIEDIDDIEKQMKASLAMEKQVKAYTEAKKAAQEANSFGGGSYGNQHSNILKGR